jgi:DNA-binding NarL/FixJ family response regulator
MSVMVRDESTRDSIREDLHAAVRARKVAKLRYEEAMVRARAEGWSNTQIARACGVSEAAIRLYWQRHPLLLGSTYEARVS